MRRKIVVGNWKMNGSLASNESLLKALTEKIPTLKIHQFVGVLRMWLNSNQELLQVK